MPSLEEALKANPRSRFLIQIKDGDRGVGDISVAYLEERGLAQWDRLAFFGSAWAVSRIKSLRPEARAWTAGSTARCLSQYLRVGWTGRVPKACNDGIIMVPIVQSGFVWGWPNRFLERMRKHRTEVMLIGRIDGLSGANFSRLDTEEEVKRLPPGFDGSIWTDHIDVIGPVFSIWPGSSHVLCSPGTASQARGPDSPHGISGPSALASVSRSCLNTN
jgi:glycerophosphoryl diester phosphodiesterase